MKSDSTHTAKSAFNELGFQKSIERHLAEIRALYSSDNIPWVVGYSGGKDSTAALQLVWLAISSMESAQRNKPIYVITNDTLVENPIVVKWVTKSLLTLETAAESQGLPVKPVRLAPDISDSFWTNLIGRGYPAPRPMFRWCTHRLKINPSSVFVNNVVKSNGEAILVLGTRKAESATRARTIDRHDQKSVREHLSPHNDLPNSYIYSPIKDWSNDDVWLFLMQVKNPWGINNKDLLTMYQGASADGECPLVLDTNTPSCGDSRFGCWVCTLVDKDKSMQAMIQNDQEKEWMLPLLELRNALDIEDDKPLRDFRRLKGNVQLHNGSPIHGPYTQKAREHWLRLLLKAQKWVRQNGPEDVRGIELITQEELHEIRRIWVVDKHEIEDLLPIIYMDETGEPFPEQPLDDLQSFSGEELELLKDICGDDFLHYELIRELLDVERRYQVMSRRAGLYDALEQAFVRNYYDNVDDAVDRARRKQQDLLTIQKNIRIDGTPK